MAPFPGGSYICGPVLVRFPVLRTQKTDLTISMFFDLNPEQEIHAKRSRDMRPVHTQCGKNRVGRISEIPFVKQRKNSLRKFTHSFSPYYQKTSKKIGFLTLVTPQKSTMVLMPELWHEEKGLAYKYKSSEPPRWAMWAGAMSGDGVISYGVKTTKKKKTTEYHCCVVVGIIVVSIANWYRSHQENENRSCVVGAGKAESRDRSRHEKNKTAVSK